MIETSRRQVNPVSPNDPGMRHKVLISFKPKDQEALLDALMKLQDKVAREPALSQLKKVA